MCLYSYLQLAESFYKRKNYEVFYTHMVSKSAPEAI